MTRTLLRVATLDDTRDSREVLRLTEAAVGRNHSAAQWLDATYFDALLLERPEPGQDHVSSEEARRAPAP